MGCMQSSNGLAAASHTARGYARLLLLTFMFVAFTNSAGAQNANVRPPSNAVTQAVPAAPSGVETWNDDHRVKIWEKLRHGYSGKASIPDPNAGVLVQAVDVLGDHGRRNAGVLKPGDGAVRRVGAGVANHWPPQHRSRPVACAAVGVGDKFLVGDGCAVPPDTLPVAIGGDA